MTLSMWLTLALVVLAIVSRPIEARLWRDGRISDRTLTVLLLGRLPVLVFLVGLIWWGPDPLTTIVVPLLVAAGELLAYPLIRTLMDDARSAREKAPPAT